MNLEPNSVAVARVTAAVVPLDGSPFGEHALPIALELARRMGVTLEIVHVHGSIVPDRYVEGLPSIEWWDSETRKEELAYLEAVRARWSAPDVEIRTTLLDDPSIAAAILRHVAETRAGIIVMSTHGRHGLARAWLGSVADEIARSAPVPLLLVRPGIVAPVVESRTEIRHIVVAVGPEDRDAPILGHVAPLARAFGAKVTLLRVVPPPLRIGGHALPVDERRQRAVAERANQVLDGVVQSLSAAGVTAQARVLSHEQTAATILEFVAAEKGELVVVGAGRRSGPGRLLLGSVADKVVRGAATPVLLLPHPAI